ncbi:hypothetical protein LN483_00015 [Xanthomonas euvesicatoria pv. euvesicatoria]|nr:hypothetical protein [Xanthomonas euvesicatoria]MCC8637959.1 hypothetical protein [Xanthomonas euvesicatoria pv. euvesicatoria]
MTPMTTEIALYFAIAAITITAIAHLMLCRTIRAVESAANSMPSNLRGVSPEEALVKVEQWRKQKRALWTLGIVVALGPFVLASLS